MTIRIRILCESLPACLRKEGLGAASSIIYHMSTEVIICHMIFQLLFHFSFLTS